MKVPALWEESARFACSAMHVVRMSSLRKVPICLVAVRLGDETGLKTAGSYFASRGANKTYPEEKCGCTELGAKSSNRRPLHHYARDGQLFAEDRSNVLYRGIDNLRSLGVQHFGLLKVYEDYVTDSSKFAQCLKILKRIVTHIQRAARQDRGCPPVVYTVLGVRLTQDIHRLKVGKFNTVFRPTFFIAITHLSVPYTDTAESLVYPMSMISTPGNITRNSAQKNAYPDLSSINKAVDDLDWMRNNSKSDMSFYISLSMRARYYTLDTASGVTFDLFGPSKKSTNGEYKEDIDPKHVRFAARSMEYYYRYNSTVGAEYTFSPQENRTLVFDSERGVNEKFCAALDRRKNLKVSVAVYDIDFDQADVACPNLYMGRGPFRRVKVLKVLSRQHPLDIYWIESKALKEHDTPEHNMNTMKPARPTRPQAPKRQDPVKTYAQVARGQRKQEKRARTLTSQQQAGQEPQEGPKEKSNHVVNIRESTSTSRPGSVTQP
ncbi:hypothetical protein MRX96_057068 [Rhipicephalus microplus]